MQFSDSMSTESSSASTPRHGVKAAGGRGRSPAAPAVTSATRGDAAAQLNCTVRAFQATTSSERRGSNDAPASELRIELTTEPGGVTGPAVPKPAITMRAPALADSSESDDDDDVAAGVAAQRRPLSQQSPPSFFAKAAAAPAASRSAAAAVAAPAHVKAFRMVHSSSSSSSSADSAASDHAPAVQPTRTTVATATAAGTAAVTQQLQLHRRTASATSSVASSSSASDSNSFAQKRRRPAAAAQRSASASSSGSSGSDLVLQRLALPSSPQPARHQDPHRSSAAIAAPVSASTLTETGRTDVTSGDAGVGGASLPTSHASPLPTTSGAGTGPTPAFPGTAAAAAAGAAAAAAKTGGVVVRSPLSASPATVSLPSSTRDSTPLPLMRPTAVLSAASAAAAAAAPRGHGSVSSFEDATGDGTADDDELDSSAASRAAQAALDAEEQRQMAQLQNAPFSTSSPALSTMAAQAFSVAPSMTPIPAYDTASSAGTPPPQHVHVPASEQSAGGGDGRSRRATSPAQPGSGRQLLSPAEPAELKGADGSDALLPLPDAGEAHETTSPQRATAASGTRRQPPPPPTPSTATKKSPANSSAVQPDAGGGAYGDHSSHSSSTVSASFPVTDWTTERQAVPATATHGTATTHAASAEAAQAVVYYSASLLPPTRSSSSSGGDRSGKGGGGLAGHAARPRVPSPGEARRVRADHSISSEDHHSHHHTDDDDDDDTEAMSVPYLHRPPPAPPSAAATEHSGTLEEVGAVEQNTASATLPSTVSADVVSVLMKAPPPASRDAPAAACAAAAPTPKAVGPATATTEPHGGTATAVLRTAQTTPRDALYTPTSAVLMPPSPPQPRASGPALLKATSPDATAGTSSSASSAAAEVAARVPAAALASCAAKEEEETSDDSLSAVVAQPAAAEVSRRMVMRRLPDSPSSSSSSSSSAPHPRGARAAQLSTQLSSDDVSSSGLARRNQEPQPQQAPSDSGEVPPTVVITAAPAGPASPTKDRWPAPDDDDEGGADTEEAADDDASAVGWEDLADEGGAQADNPRAVQEAGRWNDVLASMELTDVTVVSRVFQQLMPPRRTSHGDAGVESDADDADEVCLFKVLSLFPLAGRDARARWPLRPRVQRQLLALAEEMRTTQAALDDAGLTAAGVGRTAAQSSSSSASHAQDATDPYAHCRTRTTCAGVAEVYVDATCRLVAQLEVEPYMVSLRQLVAGSSGTGLRENELLALLRTVVCKAATMHAAGFVHGALHAGNVLLSSYDGDAVLTQPCGLMSQSRWLPSDLSVISVARARAMARFLPSVWGARQLHVGSATSTRLGAPQRPDTTELIAYHNLAALGWAASADEADGDAYVATEADDLHALGMIAFFMYTGIPPFHMTSLWAAVERLVALGDAYQAALHASSSAAVARQAARRVVADFCFGTAHERHRRNSSGGGGATGAAAAPALPDLFTCAYGTTQRHVVARFRPELEEALQTFVVDCVEAACLATATSATLAPALRGYPSAVELLERHPIFRHFALPRQAGEEGEEDEAEVDDSGGESPQGADERMRDTVHRVAYPAFCVWTGARDGCGSAPHLSRLHANALFAARCTALCESVLGASSSSSTTAHDGDDDAATLQAVLCPQVTGTLRTWRVPFPSINAPQCCSSGGSGAVHELGVHAQTSHHGGAIGGHANTHASWRSAADVRAMSDVPALRDLSALLRPSPAAAPSWPEAAHEMQGDQSAGQGAPQLMRNGDGLHASLSTYAATPAEAALAAKLFAGADPRRSCHAPAVEEDFTFMPHLHALALTEKQEAAFSLSRAFVLAHVALAADTLVLQHLTDCTVTVLAPFRYVVMDGLQRCEVRLGPCTSCVLRDVHECALIAVAALQLSGNNVTESHLSWSGQDGGRPRLERFHGITTSLYGLAYEGLGQDYARVGLVPEHAASLAVTGDTDTGAAPRHHNRRTVALCATTATSASRTQIEVGLCLAPESPHAHALLSCSTRYVHGGSRSGEAWARPSDVFHFYGELGERDVTVCDVHGSSRDAAARPILVLLGALGDVAVERCSFCTIVIAGTPSNLQASDCHDCQLIFMAREAVVENCVRVDCVALATEYLLLRACDGVRLRPLFLDCPFSDEILRRVVEGSAGGAEEATVMGAYEAGRMDELNAVLRGVGQGVHVEESIEVVVEDAGFYYERRRGRGAGDGSHNSAVDAGDEEEDDGDGLSVVLIEYASMPGPHVPGNVSETSQFAVEAAQALAEHLSVPCYVEPLQRYGADPSTSEAADDEDQRPTVCFHDLLDSSVLRLQGALCPLESQRLAAVPLATATSPNTAATLVDLSLERLHGGVLYVEDAVHTLRLRRCTGPLDVAVCAATTVLMEGCVGVQLRVACVDFRATDCAHCHVALHVTNPPQYQRCTSVQTSTLNITARDMEAMLAAAGVDLAGNAYAAPMLLTEDWATTAAAGRPDPSLQPGALHAFCAGSVEALTSPHSTADMCAAVLASVHREQLHPRFSRSDDGSATPRVPPDQVPLVMALLRQPVTVVAPLPGLCVSPDAAPFLEELETRVAAWSRRPLAVSREEAMGVALYALADIAEVYAQVPEWRSTATEDTREEPDAVPSPAPAATTAASADHLAALDDEAKPEAAAEQAGASETAPGHTAGDAAETAIEANRSSTPPAEEVEAVVDTGALIDRADADSGTGHDGVAAAAVAPLSDSATEAGAAGEEREGEGACEANAMRGAKTISSATPTRNPLPTAPPVVQQHADPVRLTDEAGEHTTGLEGEDGRADAGVASAGGETVVVHSDMSLATSMDGVLSDLPTGSGTSPVLARLAGAAGMAQVARVAAAAPGSAFLTSASVEDGPGLRSGTMSSSAAGGDAPPLPPGPAHALAPVDVGASSTMDVFNRTQRDAETRVRGVSPRPELTQSPVVAVGAAALHGKVALASPLRMDEDSSASGREAAPSAASVPAAAAAADAWPPMSSRESPQRPQQHAANDDDVSTDGPLVATTAHLRAATVEGVTTTPLEEAVAAQHLPRGPDPSARASTSSSSSSEYRWRGVAGASSESSAHRGAGGAQAGAGDAIGAPRSKTAPPATNYLYLSQDSPPRPGQSSSTAATATATPTADAASHGATPFRGQSTTPGPAMVDGDTAGTDAVAATASQPVDAAGLHELLQRVEQARQAFVQRQRQLQASPGGTLEARVRAAVAKLSALHSSSDAAAAA